MIVRGIVFIPLTDIPLTDSAREMIAGNLWSLHVKRIIFASHADAEPRG
jgi:hypothetical protein